MYEERRSALPGVVAWTAAAAPGTSGQVLPDGCMDLLWWDDRLVVAGPDRHAQPTAVATGRPVSGLRFAPGTLPVLLGVPAAALCDQRVPLDALWASAEVRRLEEQVAAAPDAVAGLEAVAATRLQRTAPVDPLVLAVASSLAAGDPVSAVADRVGLGARQLHRRSLTAFGYGPKVLVRILRLQRALGLAHQARPLAEVAAVAGYADQAHLARDARDLTGCTMSQLTA